MQHERLWRPDQAAPSDNVGDVLSSIRRLIAQDQARVPPDPDRLEAQPCADAQAPMPMPMPMLEPSAPFVLGRKDLLPAQPAPVAAERDARHLHLASISQTAIPTTVAPDRAPGWQPASIADWPGPARPTEAQASSAEPPETGLSPEDEAEFAEAEAALARMTAPRPLAVVQDTQPAAPDATVAAFKETQMAQDMRMTDMGRIEGNSAIPVSGIESLGLGAAPRESRSTPNLFGEIGGMAKDATLRMLIRDAIQAELHGELGARLSQNMCQMIRQEVEAVIREICAEA